MRAFERYLLAMALGSVMAAVAAAPARSANAATLVAASSSRGQMLYENNCTTCHESIVHIRKNHRAKSTADLRRWVRRWAGELKLNWSDEEVNDVVEFLARRFYKYGGEAENPPTPKRG